MSLYSVYEEFTFYFELTKANFNRGDKLLKSNILFAKPAAWLESIPLREDRFRILFSNFIGLSLKSLKKGLHPRAWDHYSPYARTRNDLSKRRIFFGGIYMSTASKFLSQKCVHCFKNYTSMIIVDFILSQFKANNHSNISQIYVLI